MFFYFCNFKYDVVYWVFEVCFGDWCVWCCLCSWFRCLWFWCLIRLGCCMVCVVFCCVYFRSWVGLLICMWVFMDWWVFSCDCGMILVYVFCCFMFVYRDLCVFVLWFVGLKVLVYFGWMCWLCWFCFLVVNCCMFRILVCWFGRCGCLSFCCVRMGGGRLLLFCVLVSGWVMCVVVWCVCWVVVDWIVFDGIVLDVVLLWFFLCVLCCDWFVMWWCCDFSWWFVVLVMIVVFCCLVVVLFGCWEVVSYWWNGFFVCYVWLSWVVCNCNWWSWLLIGSVVVLFLLVWCCLIVRLMCFSLFGFLFWCFVLWVSCWLIIGWVCGFLVMFMVYCKVCCVIIGLILL